jgi:hypothetical protein
MGISVKAFRKHFATQSGRSGGASAASNACIPVELWGQHGDWKTMNAQKRYVKSDKDTIVVGVTGGHEPSYWHGAERADRVRIRGRSAIGGGRRRTSRCERCAQWSFRVELWDAERIMGFLLGVPHAADLVEPRR